MRPSRHLWALLVPLFLLAGCQEQVEYRFGFVAVEPNAAIAGELDAMLAELGRIESVPFENEAELTAALEAGAVDLALIENPAQPPSGVQVLMPIFPSVLHMLARHTEAGCAAPMLSGVGTHRSVFAGPDGGAGRRVLNSMTASGLIQRGEQLRLLDSPFGAAPDVFIIFGGILSDDALSRLGGYCLVGFDEAERLGRGSVVEAFSLRYPQLEPFLLPRGLYPKLTDRASVTLAVQTLLVARDHIDEDFAFDVVARINENAASLRKVYPMAYQNVMEDLHRSSLSLAVHPGTERYLDRDAPGFLERYAEVMALLVALSVAIVSAAVAMLSARRRARKDRLDVYLERLVRTREAVRSGVQTPEEGLLDLNKLRNTVVQLLVDERVDADHALVSFLLLSSQLADEISSLAERPA